MSLALVLAVDHLFSRPIGRDAVVVRGKEVDDLEDLGDVLTWAVPVEPVTEGED